MSERANQQLGSPMDDIGAILKAGMDPQSEGVMDQATATGKAAVRAAYAFAQSMMSNFTLFADILFHRNLGERYLTITRLLLAWVAAQIQGFVVAAVFSLFRHLPHPNSPFDLDISPGTKMLALAIFIGSIVQWMVVKVRIHRGVRCHSRYWGDSNFYSERLFGRFCGQYRFQLSIEPLLVCILGGIVGHWDPEAGGYLIGFGLMLFIRAALYEGEMRDKLLDRIDSEIESDAMQDLYRGWKEPSLGNTSGYVVPPFVVQAGPPRRSRSTNLLDAIAALHPQLQELMGERAPRLREPST